VNFLIQVHYPFDSERLCQSVTSRSGLRAMSDLAAAATSRKEPVEVPAVPAAPAEESSTAGSAVDEGAATFARGAEKLVVDSGAIILHTDLRTLGTELFTTEEVVEEIRDESAREWLARAPFSLERRVPSAESLRAVGAAARKTGDWSALSAVDVGIMALAYQLHQEARGLSVEPPPAKAGAPTAPSSTGVTPVAVWSKPAPWAKSTAASAPSSTTPCGKFDDVEEELGEATHKAPPSNSARMASAAGADLPTADDVERSKAHFPSLAAAIDSGLVKVPPAPEPVVWKGPPRSHVPVFVPASESAASGVPVIESAASSVAAEPQEPLSPPPGEREEEEDDGEGEWATPQALARADVVGGGSALGFTDAFGGKDAALDGERERPAVACITTDFACQNVLMHLGVPVVGVDGRRVQSLRRWVLKCDACFHVTTDMGRLFCPQCGSNTLRRLACTRGADGELVFHYSKHKADPSLRGTQYSIPAPKGGRDGDILLREDQLLVGVWKQRAQASRKPREGFFAEAAASSFGGSWSGPHEVSKPQSSEASLLTSVRGAPGIVVGMGKNPNASRGRERRGQKKSKRAGK
jgi:RNA-binding protein NOB1